EATAALLWEACHRRPDGHAVRAAVEGGADLPRAVVTAVHQRVAPLLWRAVQSAGLGTALGEAGAQLEEVAMVHRLEGMLLLPDAVATAVAPLTGAGLEPLVLKGPALTVRYPEVGLRPMDDIDLLLPRCFHAPALDALRRAGWYVVRSSARDRYDTVLRHPDVPALALELHYGLDAWYERATALDAEELWRRRVEIDCLGTPAFGLPLPEELVMLCVHAAKPYHCFSRLVWIADLAMVLGHRAEAGLDVDWSAVQAVARAGRCTTQVAAALTLAGHAGVTAPPGAFPLPDRGWRAAALGVLADSCWPLGGRERPTFHLRYALTDSLLRRFVLLIGSTHGQPLTRRASWQVRAIEQAARRWWALRGGKAAGTTVLFRSPGETASAGRHW
ncbi:MAG TPA: nucleotidyltransferase family protein, partial [Acidimicrobiales bacterium]|nr:nucleotidyltransferase family protein [Acidimicrobiales bacterium]